MTIRAIILAAVIFTASPAAASAIPEERVPGRTPRLQQITELLRPHLQIVTQTGKFFCLRLLPTNGDEAIVVVRQASTIPYAEKLLAAAGLKGSVELRSRNRWEQEMSRLAAAVTAEVPEEFRPAIKNIGLWFPFHFYECIKVSMELPLLGMVPPDMREWAEGEIIRYGFDRVSWYYMPLVTLD
jgi:hypothetical protein